MRWYSYVVGYLIIIIEGQFPEKVINMSLARGIFLWDITDIGQGRIMLKIRLQSIKPLRHIVKQSKCKMKIMKRKGLPFEISRAKKRKVLALGGFIFLLGFYILSSFVWFIEVKGTDDLTPLEVKEYARIQGLEPGAKISKLNIDEIEVRLQDSHPKIAWVGISRTGTKFTIEIAEKVLIPETEDHKKADLVAKHDAVIEEMLVLIGIPQVKEGDRVEKGQLLVSGMVYPDMHFMEDGTIEPGGEPQLARAKGIIRGRVKYSIIASCPLNENVINHTGRSLSQIILILKDYQIIIGGPKEIPYQEYKLNSSSESISWRKMKIPVEVITNNYIEIERSVIHHGHEGAYQEAIDRGDKALERVVTKEAKLLGKEVKLNPTGIKTEGMVEVEVIWETLENIGVHQAIKEGEIPNI